MVLAITTMIGISIASAIMAIVTNSRRDASQAAAYESLRMAASQIMQDVRFAKDTAQFQGGASLTLPLNDDGTAYIRYIFASYNAANPGSPTPDPNRLHRWVVKGGTWQDEIIAADMVPYQAGNPNSTRFTADVILFGVNATLVRQPLPGQPKPIQMQVFVHFR